jgi:hypothetical protein
MKSEVQHSEFYRRLCAFVTVYKSRIRAEIVLHEDPGRLYMGRYVEINKALAGHVVP